MTNNTYVITVDGAEQARRATRQEAEDLANKWRASGRNIEVKTQEQFERDSAPMIPRTPQGLQIDGWDV